MPSAAPGRNARATSERERSVQALLLTPLAGRVLVLTGAGGFLGSHILEQLLALPLERQPFQIRCVDTKPEPLVAEHAEHPRVLWRQASVTDRHAMAAACKGADVVIHAASLVDWGRFPEAALWEVNRGGTRNVVGIC